LQGIDSPSLFGPWAGTTTLFDSTRLLAPYCRLFYNSSTQVTNFGEPNFLESSISDFTKLKYQRAAAQLIVPDWGDKVDYGIGLSYRHVGYIGWRAGTTTQCYSRLYPPARDYGFGYCCERSSIRRWYCIDHGWHRMDEDAKRSSRPCVLVRPASMQKWPLI
jgi:hypothetical protein